MQPQDLLAPWDGPAGGIPPFATIRPEHADLFAPAFALAMQAQRDELAAIAHNPEPATFDNTVRALEASGAALQRVSALFEVYTLTCATPAIQAVEAELAPKLANFADELFQNAALFARLAHVYEQRHGLAPEALRLVEVLYQQFVRRGARLEAAAQARLRDINGELAGLFAQFSQNELHDEETQWLVLGEPELEGIPEAICQAAKQLATAHGDPTAWHVANTRSAMEPVLTFAAQANVRARAFALFSERGNHAGAHDNKPLMARIVALRTERARLLGHPSHAHWAIADNMAQTPAAAAALLHEIWPHAKAAVLRDAARMHVELGAPSPMPPSDYRYYAERLRVKDAQGGALAAVNVSEYLVLDQLRDAMFWVAAKLYQLSFVRRSDIATYHPDVACYEVNHQGAAIGLWYFDPYARPGKRSGAWMSEYRTQRRLTQAVLPLVSNNANFMRGAAGEPVRISWDDATTLFHEFGHAMHGLLSNVQYPTLAGTNVRRDFVEFPSQLHELWLSAPTVLARYARHYQTGEALPPTAIAALAQAKHQGAGFRTAEYLLSAMFDLALHTTPETTLLNGADFERTLDAPPCLTMRHRPTHFSHIFSSDGYAAGYYVYLWADVLTADAAEAFVQRGYFDTALAHALRHNVLARGNTIEPDAAFMAMMGRRVDATALLRARGFAPPA